MAKEEAKSAGSLKILGQDLELTVKTNGEAVVSMKKADFDSILESKGVTKEVRKTVQAAHDEITADVLKAENEWLLKTNKGIKEDDPKFVKSIEARLGGSGDGSMAIKLTGHKVHTGKDIRSGKSYESHKWGIASVTLNYALASDLRKEGGMLDQISAAWQKALPSK